MVDIRVKVIMVRVVLLSELGLSLGLLSGLGLHVGLGLPLGLELKFGSRAARLYLHLLYVLIRKIYMSYHEYRYNIVKLSHFK